MTNIILPFLLGIFFAYLIYPFVDFFEKNGLKKHLSIIFVYIHAIVIVIAIASIFSSQIIDNINELLYSFPQTAELYREKVNILLNMVIKSGFPDDIKNMIFSEVLTGIRDIEKKAFISIKDFLIISISYIPCMFGLLISLVIAYYLLNDIEVFKKSLSSLLPRRYKNDITIVGREINNIIKSFIQCQILTSMIVGVLITIGLLIAKVKFPFVLGIIGGITNLIPYFGPIIGAICAFIVGTSQSLYSGINSAVVFVIVQQIDNVIISPRMTEKKIGLHPITTIFVVIVGGELFGILGMLFAVPIFASLKVIVNRIIERIV